MHAGQWWARTTRGTEKPSDGGLPVSQNSTVWAVAANGHQTLGVDVVPGEPGQRTARVPSTCRAPAAVGAAAFPRKEVIQPQLPLRLPCYDFTPIAEAALDASLVAQAPRLHAFPTFVV